MNITVTLDLDRYDLDTLATLWNNGVLSLVEIEKSKAFSEISTVNKIAWVRANKPARFVAGGSDDEWYERFASQLRGK